MSTRGKRFTGVYLMVLLALGAGCKSRSNASPPATNPSTRPQAAATEPLFPDMADLSASPHMATPQEIDSAIERAKKFLLGQQDKNGNWEPAAPVGNQALNPSATTALVTYALLSAGVAPADAQLQPAIQLIADTKTHGTYALSLRFLVWASLPGQVIAQNNIAAAIGRDWPLLVQGAPDAKVHGPSMFYGDTVPTQAGDSIDHFNSALAVQGMRAYDELGVNGIVQPQYWQAVDAGWRAHQFDSGAWSFNVGAEVMPPAKVPWNAQPSVSMTAAGIATLFITDDCLFGNVGANCVGNIVDPQIEAGLKWLDENFPRVFQQDQYRSLYNVSRAGLASGRKYFGHDDWYEKGADFLVKIQAANGSWGQDPVSDTAYALLFLVRSRPPVAMNKLEYELDTHGNKERVANWNERPRDVANVVNWIGKQNERMLRWQVVNLRSSVDDLHDAPILYIAGNQPLQFTDAELGKLRQFVEEGGIIFANADGESMAFHTGLVRICHKLFPDYEFRNLPQESPIYNSEQFHKNKWLQPMRVDALSNGVRELVIILSRDPARFWQLQDVGGRREAFQFAADVLLYATDESAGGGWRAKGETYIVRPDPKIQAARTIKIARLQFAGNWNPEPGGWRRLAAILHNTEKTDLDVRSVILGDAKLDKSFQIAHLTGTFKIKFTDAQRDEIKHYVEAGGTLIVDAAGGDVAFAQSAENELALIFPDSKLGLTPLPLSNAIFSGGPKLDQVRYRHLAVKLIGNLQVPRIRAIEINGRPAVFFSAEDLSVGMVGMQIDGIFGYDPASATALMEKLVLFASK